MRNHKIKIFENISEATKEAIIKESNSKTYSKGEVIHFDLDICEHLDFIVRGSVEVEHLNQYGDKLIVKVFDEGDVVGLNVAFSSSPVYIMNFIAREEVELLRISKVYALSLMREDEVLLHNILRTLSDNSVSIGNRIKQDFKVTIKEQLLTYLFSLYRKQKRNPVMLPISKTELATHFGVSRTSVSRELARMENEEIVSVAGKYITIHNLRRP